MSGHQESHILEEEEKLEEETQQTRSEFHHQFVMEIQEAVQLVQQHMEQGIGQTLLQHARQEATKQSSEDREDLKVLGHFPVALLGKKYLDKMEESFRPVLSSVRKLCKEDYDLA